MKNIRKACLVAAAAVAIAALSGAVPTPLRAQSSSAQQKIDLMVAALKARDAGDLDGAKRNLEELLKIAPKDPGVQQLMLSVNREIERRKSGEAPVYGAGRLPIGEEKAVEAPKAAPAKAEEPKVEKKAAVAAAPKAEEKPVAKVEEKAPAKVAKADEAAPKAETSAAAESEKRSPVKTTSLKAPASEKALATKTEKAPAPAEPVVAKVDDKATKDVAEAMTLNREELFKADRAARKTLEKANKQVAAGDYEGAQETLKAAQAETPVAVATEEIHEKLKAERSAIYLKQVDDAVKARNIPAARRALEDYATVRGKDGTYEGKSAQLDKLAVDPYYQSVNAVSPGYAARQQKVNNLLVKGRSQYLYGDYQGALQTFREVDVLDQDNVESRAYQIRIVDLLEKQGVLNRELTRNQMLDEVNRAWQRPKVYVAKEATDEDPSARGGVVRQRLQSIVIPHVQFNRAPLDRVVATLAEFSRDYDNSKDGKRGVNMMVVGDTGGNLPVVSFELRDLTLERILDRVSQATNYGYEIEDGIVTFRPSQISSNLQRVFINVSKNVIDRIIGAAGTSTQAAAPAASGSPFGKKDAAAAQPAPAQDAASDKNAKVKEFFVSAGIPFDPGATIAVTGNDTEIIVTQTPANIRKIEDTIRRLRKTEAQVEIESKFLEVRQGALDELGFKWNVSNPHHNQFFSTANGTKGNFPSPKSNVPFDTNQTGTAATTNNLRSMNERVQSPGSAGQTGAVISNVSGGTLLNTFVPSVPGQPLAGLTGSNAGPLAGGVLGVLDGYRINMVINALEQTQGSDMLCAPKVTTMSGERATISVGQTMIYPKGYRDLNVQTSAGDGGSSVGITAAAPESFESQNVGVDMSVTPTVNLNDRTITMKLDPVVTEFEGFVEYGGQSVAIAGNISAMVPPGFLQPIFSKRQVTTKVVIEDGATVVMGGLTREDVRTVHDKVPFLGDIPLLGNLFQSKSESREKRNLLIFVTANIISAGGSPVYQDFRSVSRSSLFQNPVIVTPGTGVNREVPDEKPAAAPARR